jgi:hypothetical protein
MTLQMMEGTPQRTKRKKARHLRTTPQPYESGEKVETNNKFGL